MFKNRLERARYNSTESVLIMKRYLSLLIVCFLIISCAETEQESALQYAEPSSLGFNAELLSEIDSLLIQQIDEEKIAGAVALIAKDGQIAYEKAFGWKDIESNSEMNTDQLFRIASMTKLITTVAIMQLYEEGQISLDDPLEQYIPEFSDPVVLTSFDEETGAFETRPATRRITIHDLLTHTSGIQYGFSGQTFGRIYSDAGVPDLGTEQNRTIEETMVILGNLPLAHDPGEAFTYGLNTDVLGRVVEVVSGTSLANYFTENIFTPLGMSDTAFYHPGREDDLATLYTIRDEIFMPLPNDENTLISPNFPVQGAMTYYSGGAGLTSTALDYFIFLQTLLNGGIWNDDRILDQETWEMMISNQIGDLWDDNKFGYGLMITMPEGVEEGFRPVGSLGWGGAFQTTFWIDPANELVVVLMTQVIPSPYRDELFESFERALYSAL